ncbi:uncharacterized protein EI97DRAFT_225687 [Westerdykella ornata]|uniref:Uncharacterized protein n=1 Tax=Westerdykella ornata TaxID=318751 RepID=A0A6A6JVF7_WESOR|nr:uncharacterized protein EI97DRAFT_225687 [Westerdykella ornata]KAF2279029.1 hypothetical protein EI97DRAFT_225687 [Westerdykella ornata]
MIRFYNASQVAPKTGCGNGMISHVLVACHPLLRTFDAGCCIAISRGQSTESCSGSGSRHCPRVCSVPSPGQGVSCWFRPRTICTFRNVRIPICGRNIVSRTLLSTIAHGSANGFEFSAGVVRPLLSENQEAVWPPEPRAGLVSESRLYCSVQCPPVQAPGSLFRVCEQKSRWTHTSYRRSRVVASALCTEYLTKVATQRHPSSQDWTETTRHDPQEKRVTVRPWWQSGDVMSVGLTETKSSPICQYGVRFGLRGDNKSP